MASKKDGNTPVEQTPKEKEFHAGTKVTPEMFARIMAEAERQGVSPRAVVRQALAAFLAGEKPPVKAESVDRLLSTVEERVADLDRRIDACAIAAVRVADRVAAIAPPPKV